MPRSRYSKISRRPGVHLAAVAASTPNVQSLVSDIISSCAGRTRYYSFSGIVLSRRERRAPRMADPPPPDRDEVPGIKAVVRGARSCRGERGANMRRREFLGSAAAAWPVVARAQQPGSVRRIGILMGGAEGDSQNAAGLAAFA